MQVYARILHRDQYLWSYMNIHSICMYMQVYACIWTYMHVWCSQWRDTLSVTQYMHIYACTYSLPKSMHVYACICHICMYIASICMYIQLWPPKTLGLMPPPQITVSVDTIKRAQHRTPLGIWQVGFIRHRQHFCRPDFRHYPAQHASWASAAPSWILREAPRAITELVDSVPWPITGDMADWITPSSHRMSAASAPKHLQTSIWWSMSKYKFEHICM